MSRETQLIVRCIWRIKQVIHNTNAAKKKKIMLSKSYDLYLIECIHSVRLKNKATPINDRASGRSSQSPFSYSVGAWSVTIFPTDFIFSVAFTEISKNALDILQYTELTVFQFKAYHMINNLFVSMSQNMRRRRSTDVKCPRRSSETVRSSQARDWSTPQCQTHAQTPACDASRSVKFF